MLYPEMWRYKRGDSSHPTYICTWGCLRKYDNGEWKERGRVDITDKHQKAIDIALEGGNPISYLTECGSKNPSAAWYAIKQKVKKNDPETYAKLQRDLRKDRPKAEKPVETPEDGTAVSLKNVVPALVDLEDAMEGWVDRAHKKGLKTIVDDDVEAKLPEAPRICKPVNYEGFDVREVEGAFARYRRSDVGDKTYVDVEIHEGCDTLSYTVEQWRNLHSERVRAFVILGVGE